VKSLTVPSPDDAGEGKISRRNSIKWLGAIAVVGAVGLVLGDTSGQLTNQAPTMTSTTTKTQTIADPQTDTDTVTNTQTETETQTQTLTNIHTETQTLTDTQTQIVTDVQMETQTLTDTQIETVTASASSSSSSTSTASETTTTAAGNFSIFWITDTQFLSESNPAVYAKLTDWIVENWSTYNGKFVIHTGDLVQTGDQQVEWENANAAMSTLLQNGIPYTWCAGNHDDLVPDETSSGWNGNVWASAFDPSTVGPMVDALQYASWVGDYHSAMNTAASFSANGLDFLVVNLEWAAGPDVIQWVGGILDDPAYADYHVIIAPHAYLNAYGVIPDSSNDIDLTSFVSGLNALMDQHPNVFLTLNGHYATDCGYNTAFPVNGRNELMFDRQNSTDNPGDPTGRGADPSTSTTPDASKLGGATATILTFDTANNEIRVTTYDVYTSTWRTDQYEKYSFTMFPPTSGSTTTTTSANSSE
jgi:hypothetical protein